MNTLPPILTLKIWVSIETLWIDECSFYSVWITLINNLQTKLVPIGGQKVQNQTERSGS